MKAFSKLVTNLNEASKKVLIKLLLKDLEDHQRIPESTH
jgi:hypothetical protein